MILCIRGSYFKISGGNWVSFIYFFPAPEASHQIWMPFTSPVGHLGAQMRSRRAGLVLPSLLRGYMEVRLSTRETSGSETCKPEGRTDAAAAPPPRNLSFPVSLRSSAAGAPLLPWITSTVCTAFRGSGTSGGAFTENYTNKCQSNRNSSPSTN